MDQIYPDATLLPLLEKVVGPAGLRWRLYTNNLTPTLASVIGDFTQAAWAGYASVLRVSADFPIKAVVTHLGSYIAAPVGFVNTSGAPVTTYGYYITDVATGDLVACARFDDAPRTIPDGGATQVVPIIADFSGLS